jgi:lysophospholipase L1-like esterase
MKKGFTVTKAWIYAGLIVAGGIGVAKVVARPLIKRGGRLLLVGDSLSVGLAPPLKALAVEAGVDWAYVGETGTRIDQWAGNSAQGGKLNALLASFQPTLVLVCLGTNDEALKKYNASTDVLAKQRPYVEQLLEKIRAAGADVAWIGPPTLAFQIPEFRAWLKAKMGGRHWFPSDKYDIPRQPDGIHATVKGYAGWSGLIWQWIQ